MGYFMFTFIEHPNFTKQIQSLFSDEEYRQFQTDLAANPESGDVIPGLSGLRKIRWAGQGKRQTGWCQNHIPAHPQTWVGLLVLCLYEGRYYRCEAGAEEAVGQLY